jgi:NTE family protein
MQLKLDPSKKYAIALEGGGAKGAYEIGVWRALREVGIEFNAISGTSVGALNGALMVMGNLEKAESLWQNITFSQIMDVNDEEMRQLFRREIGANLTTFTKRAVELIRNRGFDISPLRTFIADALDAQAVIQSDIDLYIITYSVTDRKSLELRARDLSPEQLGDMLLASAYLPAFRNEKLGGKRYTDGGVTDAVPIHALTSNGYRDIIVVRMYGFGLEKRFRLPKGTRLTTIAPTRDLGNVLNFDAEKSKENLRLGYFDAKRTLYGLYGSRYYIDRTWDEDKAYALLRNHAQNYLETMHKECTLRELNEKWLPKLGRNLKAQQDYYTLLVACMEQIAMSLKIEEFKIRTDDAFLDEIQTALSTSQRSEAEFIDAFAPKKRTFLDLLL